MLSPDEDLRRRVPAVEHLLRQEGVRRMEQAYGRDPVLRVLRGLLSEAREAAGAGNEPALARLLERLPEDLAARLADEAAPSLLPVINATGVVLHTNLGRAPLSARAAARVAEVASSYSNLEYDLELGERGRRELHAETRLRGLLGVEAALVVNNNAAAVLLAIDTLAPGREVLVSRGELVEIGGSFRIPDVLRKGGARLREVGTTNRTRLADYRAALGAETALILKVHPSNFRIVGFAESPAISELAALARETGLPLLEDLGSGLLAELPAALAEPRVQHSIAAGVDVLTFSADKLLGGPQAGVVVGRRAHVDAMRVNPLYRALRVDKMTLAGLDAVLADHETGRARREVPVLRMLWMPLEEIRRHAQDLEARLRQERPEADVALVDGASTVGGGAAPALELPSVLVAIGHAREDAEVLAERLRAGRPPVVARVRAGRLLIDLRTVAPHERTPLADALVRALA